MGRGVYIQRGGLKKSFEMSYQVMGSCQSTVFIQCFSIKALKRNKSYSFHVNREAYIRGKELFVGSNILSTVGGGGGGEMKGGELINSIL